MTTTVVYADTSDGYVTSLESVWATARSTASGAFGGSTLLIGNAYSAGNYKCREGFVQFNTSGVGTDTVSAATLSLWGTWGGSLVAGYVLEARIKDWGTSLTTADWVAGDSLGDLTLVAHQSGGFTHTDSAYTDFTNDALPANINGAGQTSLLINHSRHRVSSAPTGTDSAEVASADVSGTTKDPKLTITHAAAGFAYSQAVVIA
jgi:hypothetical protein